MFLCDTCHGRGCENCDYLHEIGGSMSRSYGPCEGCGKVRNTIDCHCPDHKPEKKPRPAGRAN